MSTRAIDLSLLKRLVLELEKTIDTANQFKNTNPDSHDSNIEFAKALGLASSLSQESMLIVSDLAHMLVQHSPEADPNAIKKILVKPDPNTN